MSVPILSLSDVTVQFGGLTACDAVSVKVERGEMFALIGPNGAGKTTIVNSITGIYRPNPGATIKYVDRAAKEHDLLPRKPHQIVRLGIARTFQNLGLFPSMSVLDNLVLGRYIHQRTGVVTGGLMTRGAVREEVLAREAVEPIIELLELGEYRWSRGEDLPYGIQKRIELGRVLAMEPDLLLLDEPMAGMTLDEKREIVRLIFEARAALNLTVVLIEHDMAVVMSIADRVMALNFGRELALGSPKDVQRDGRVIEAYLGVAG